VAGGDGLVARAGRDEEEQQEREAEEADGEGHARTLPRI
jgi:hypothetical protein